MHHALAYITTTWCQWLPAKAHTRDFTALAVATADPNRQTFALIDKAAGMLTLSAADGHLMAETPGLLGLAQGDATTPGIGKGPPRLIEPYKRTTPEGRSVAGSGNNLTGETVIRIDYDSAVLLPRFRPSSPLEKRP